MVTIDGIQVGNKFKDLTGMRFGRLAVERFSRTEKGRSFWICQCDCGQVVEAKAMLLRSGHTRSCGCLKTEEILKRNTTHGDTGSREWTCWRNMIRRCSRPGNISYKDYGGRGIDVCERWKESYEAFLADMGRMPTAKHTIERKDNDRGYSPDNCVWATRTQQARNKRNAVFVVIEGKRMHLAELSEQSGLPYEVIRKRLKRGWDVKDLAKPRVRDNRKVVTQP